MYQLQAVFACLAGFPQRLTLLFLCSQLHRQLLLLGKQRRWICHKIHLAKGKRIRLLGSVRFFYSIWNNSSSRFWRVHTFPFVTYLTWNSGSSKTEVLSYSNTWKLPCLLPCSSKTGSLGTFCWRRCWKLNNEDAIFVLVFVYLML